MEDERIVFIIGMPRSGTTWVWGLLTSTDGVIPLERTDFDPSNPSVVNGKRKTSETGAFINYDYITIKDVVNKKLVENPDSYLVEKTPSHIFKFDDIVEIFPNSKVIFLVRDPRAVVSSMVNTTFTKFTESVEDATFTYKNAYEIMGNYDDDFEKGRYLQIRYEDLLEDTETILSAIHTYMGINKLTEERQKEIIFSNTRKTKVDIDGVYRKGTADSYREDLSSDQILFIEENLAELMGKYGYEINHE